VNDRPLRDEDLPSYWRALGLPGVADAHLHFMPDRLQARVWDHFDAAGPLIGRQWPIAYRSGEQDRVRHLRALGVRWFPSLLYAHKPGMAESLNAWAADFAARTPGCLRTATFFPEPSAATYVPHAVETGARVFKAHVQVGAYDPRDPLLEPVWGALAEAQVPVVVHCGSGPVPGPFTGPGPFGEVLARHPRLVAIVAHMGAGEYAEFLDLAERHPVLHLDTAMAFSGFMEEAAPFPRAELPRLVALGDRILFGSDFPSIPYAYAHQVEALAALGLGDEWLRGVFWRNAARLWGLDQQGA
jgi:predicted TIM-barrel fold metal-dependent hydrolase